MIYGRYRDKEEPRLLQAADVLMFFMFDFQGLHYPRMLVSLCMKYFIKHEVIWFMTEWLCLSDGKVYSEMVLNLLLLSPKHLIKFRVVL